MKLVADESVDFSLTLAAWGADNLREGDCIVGLTHLVIQPSRKLRASGKVSYSPLECMHNEHVN